MNDKKKLYFQILHPYFISVGVGVICYFVVYCLFHPVSINGTSMEPTLKNGEIVVCSTEFEIDSLNRGDIIIFKHGFKTYVKRIIALPGETVSIADGRVYINNIVLTSYVFEDIADAGILTNASITLETDEFFCLGDNRNHSNDCRIFGPVAFEDIKYIVTGIFLGENDRFSYKE